MPRFKRGVELNELEALIHRRHGTGATFAELGRELDLSSSYVSAVYQVAARKLVAQRLRGAGRRTNFLNRE